MKRQKGVTVRMACVAVALLALAAPVAATTMTPPATRRHRPKPTSTATDATTPWRTPPAAAVDTSSDDVESRSRGRAAHGRGPDVERRPASSIRPRWRPASTSTARPVLRSLLVARGRRHPRARPGRQRRSGGSRRRSSSSSAPDLTFSDGTRAGRRSGEGDVRAEPGVARTPAGLLTSDMALVESITVDSPTEPHHQAEPAVGRGRVHAARRRRVRADLAGQLTPTPTPATANRSSAPAP